jgi:hypothetical protein
MRKSVEELSMYKYTTLDSQPDERLLNDANLLHTLCFCRFRDLDHASKWIHELVPKDKNGRFVKWSGSGGTARKLKRRLQFINAVNQRYDSIDFSVHCISSTESEISRFAHAFYLQNLAHITQELNDKNKNCLVFAISETKKIKIPVLRAAKLLWIYFSIKYMKEVNQLDGFIYSDWFSADSMKGEDKALGVAFVNFLLNSTGIGLQLSIEVEPGKGEADLLSDWFAGWCNTSKSGTADSNIAAKFDQLVERTPKKIDWVEFLCNMEVHLVDV